MFKRIMESRKSMEARIKELEAMNESMYKVMEKQADQICKLREEINDWQESYETVQDAYDEYVDYVEEQKEVMENYLYELKEKLEEAEGSDEYIAELEEALFKENPNHVLVKGMAQYYGERDAIDAICRVKDEVLLLMAPVVEEEVVERVEAEVYYVKEINVDFRPYLFDIEDAIDLEEVVSEANEVEYHVAMNVGLDRVGEVDEIIFLRELETEEEANEMSEVDAMKARNEERIKKALRKLKESRGKVKVSERRTPPLPPHRRKAC